MGEIVDIGRGEQIKYQKSIVELFTELDEQTFYKLALSMSLRMFEISKANVVKEIFLDNLDEANHNHVFIVAYNNSGLAINLKTGKVVRFNDNFTEISPDYQWTPDNANYLLNFRYFVAALAGDEIPVFADYIAGLLSGGVVDIMEAQLTIKEYGYSTIVLEHVDGDHLLIVMSVDGNSDPLVVLDLIDRCIYEITPNRDMVEICSVRNCVHFDHDAMLDVYIAVHQSLNLVPRSDKYERGKS